MAYRPVTLGSLIEVDPKEAKKQIENAFIKAHAKRADAAVHLGISVYTLVRYVHKLSLTKRLEQIEERAKKEKWHHGEVGGRPPKKR